MGRLRIPIRGITDSGPIGRAIDAHLTGARKVRPLVAYQRDPLGFLIDVLALVELVRADERAATLDALERARMGAEVDGPR